MNMLDKNGTVGTVTKCFIFVEKCRKYIIDIGKAHFTKVRFFGVTVPTNEIIICRPGFF